MERIKVNIERQGAPIVNADYNWVVDSSDNFVAVEIDMKSKWCEVGSTMSSSDDTIGLSLDTNERSIHLNEKCDRNEPTELTFPEFKGWNIFMAECSRYTIRIVFIKSYEKLKK